MSDYYYIVIMLNKIKFYLKAFLLTKIRAQYHHLRDIQASLGNKEAQDLKNKYLNIFNDFV